MGDMMSLRQQLALPAVTSTTIDPMTTRIFHTTNLHVHGLQVVPHIFDPAGYERSGGDADRRESRNVADLHVHLPPDQPSGCFGIIRIITARPTWKSAAAWRGSFS